MAATLSTVRIISDNPLYPQNKVDVTVDNDLSVGTTVVVANTTFPYIVEFLNYPNSQGKRYISERLFNKIANPVDGAYKNNRGKIFYNLQKGLSIYPYITLDYKQFSDKVQEERKKSIIERGKSIPELDYVGASIQSFENLTPEFILKWLDLPLVDGDNAPIKSFPNLLGYDNKPNLNVNVDLVQRTNLKDFYSTEYFVTIEYPQPNSINTSSEDSYENYTKGKDGLFDGDYSKNKKYNDINKRRKGKSLDDILSTASTVSSSILGAASLISAALALKKKLAAAAISKPTLPQKPSINFSDRLVKRKVKKAEQKQRKRKRLSNKKTKPAIQEPDIKNPAIEDLKARAGKLKNSTNTALAEANAKKAEMDAKIAELQKMSNMTPEELIAYKRSQGFKGTITVTQKGSPQ